jgi:hypothetical protein
MNPGRILTVCVHSLREIPVMRTAKIVVAVFLVVLLLGMVVAAAEEATEEKKKKKKSEGLRKGAVLGATMWVAEAYTHIDGKEVLVQSYRFTRQ